MALQALGPSQNANQRLMGAYNGGLSAFDGDRAIAKQQPARTQVNAAISAEYYSSTKFALDYTSKDGDRVSFSFESVEYQKAMLQINAEGSPEEMKELVKQIKDEFLSMKKEIMKKFVESITGKTEKSNDAEETSKASKLQVPEYWNAENTSQRIVDFAVSFFDLKQGSGEEYFNLIKAAVESGFKQARDMMGELPEEVGGLIDDTYSLVMKKLDDWAAQKNIGVAQTDPVAEAVAA